MQDYEYKRFTTSSASRGGAIPACFSLLPGRNRLARTQSATPFDARADPSDAPSSIDLEHDAGQKRRLVARKIERRRPDVLRGRKTAERHGGAEGGALLRRIFAKEHRQER